MLLLPAIYCCAALVCSALIVWMIRVGVMDMPGHRSSHTRPTPKGGGVGIVAAFVLFLPFVRLAVGAAPFDSGMVLLAGGVVLLSAFSWLDDLHSYPAGTKLAAQAASACLVAASAGFFPMETPQQFLLFGLAAAWLVFATNAINFIDGLNGLASGVMAWTALMSGVFLEASGVHADAATLGLVCVCLVTFLPFNFPRARIFMGDVGSQGAGLVIGWAALVCARDTAFPVLVPSLLSGVLYDVAFTLIRRAIAGDPLMQAHRGHLYQIATRVGLPAPFVSLVHWAFVGWGAVVASGGASWPVSLALVLAPQFLWTLVVCARARRVDPGRW